MKRAWQLKRQRLPVGSTYTDTHGYVRVKVVPGKGRWQLQHALAMKKVLGRELVRGEVIHHINGNRADNAAENLYLCRDASHHNEVHRTQDAALRECLRAGLVVFKEGRYEAVLPRA